MNLAPGFPALPRPGHETSSPRLRRAIVARPTALPSSDHDASARSRLWLVYATAISSGLAFSVGWLVTETIASAVLGWVAAALLIYTVRARQSTDAGLSLRPGCLRRGFLLDL